MSKSYKLAVSAALALAAFSSSPAFAASSITCNSPTNATSCTFFHAFGTAPGSAGEVSPGAGTDTFTFSVLGMKRLSGVIFTFFNTIDQNVNFPGGRGAPSITGGTLTSPARFQTTNLGNPDVRSIDDLLLGAGTYTLTVRYNAGPNARYDGVLGLVSAIPEPATWAMMILGFGLVGGALRARKGAAASLATA